MKKLFLIGSILLALSSLAFAGGPSGVFMLKNPGWVYTRNGDNLTYKATIDIGTEVGGPYDTFVPAKINNTKNEWGTIYAEISYDGENCWTPASFIGSGDGYGEVRVVKEDSPVFTVNSIASIEAKKVPAGTVVSIISDDDDSRLVCVEYYNAKVFARVIKAYMLRSSLSTSEGDYNAVILTNAALQKDAAKQKEQMLLLLSEAEAEAESKGICQFVADAKAPLIGADMSNSPVEDCSRTGNISSDGAKVNVREKPGKSGKQVTQIPDGCGVIATKRTSKKETIGGETDYWYFIATPGADSVEGWIFGSTVKWND